MNNPSDAKTQARRRMQRAIAQGDGAVATPAPFALQVVTRRQLGPLPPAWAHGVKILTPSIQSCNAAAATRRAVSKDDFPVRIAVRAVSKRDPYTLVARPLAGDLFAGRATAPAALLLGHEQGPGMRYVLLLEPDQRGRLTATAVHAARSMSYAQRLWRAATASAGLSEIEGAAARGRYMRDLVSRPRLAYFVWDRKLLYGGTVYDASQTFQLGRAAGAAGAAGAAEAHPLPPQ